MTTSRLGEPVELPWWVIPLAAPPALVILAGIIIAAPLWAHLLAIAASLATLAALTLVAVRIPSRNMQSVWISALYAAWVFAVITWIVAVVTTPHCNCA